MKMKRKINKPFLASPKLSQLQIEKEAEKMESDTSSWSTIASMVSTLSSSSPQSRKTKHRSHYFMSTPPPPPPPPPPQSKPKQKRKPNRCSSMGTTTSTAFTPSIDNSENRKRPLCQSNALPMDEETENFAHDKHASCHQDQKCTVIQTKKSISSLEVEHGSSSTSSQPKFPRKQKTRRNNNKNCRDNIDETTDHYQAMDEDGVFRDSPLSNCSVRLPAHPPSSAPIPWHTHDDDDDETLRDFRESDWTPPDSSYGAAIPVAGWIPKPIRRMIESTLIVLGTVGLVYLIITTSIRITGDNNSSNNNRQNNGSVNGTQSGGNNNNNNMDYYYVNNQENNNDFGVANDDEYIVSSSYYDSYQNKDNNNNDNNAQQEDEEKGDDFYN
jgi:hypothetical protein